MVSPTLNIPRKLIAGDTVSWRDSFSAYKPETYSLSWAIRGATVLNLIAQVEGDEYISTISASASAGLNWGTYYFQAYLSTMVGHRLTIGGGQITVVANLETSLQPYDGSTTAQKMLLAVETAIQARLSGGAVDSYEIRGRSLARTPLPELVVLRNQLKIEVAREQAAAGLMPDSRRLFIKFRGM